MVSKISVAADRIQPEASRDGIASSRKTGLPSRWARVTSAAAL
jgi:hypothetical protein